MPPAVRDLNSLIAEQYSSLQPQLGLLDQSIAANDSAGSAQVAGIEAKKTAAFKGIGQEAQDKGMFFSGFAPNEEANYVGGTYLPALAQLESEIVSSRNNLLGKKAELGKQAFDTAFATREGDVKVLRDWEQRTADQKFQASEAEKQRVFEAQQNERTRQAQSAAKGPKDVSGIVNAVGQFLQGKVGRDGKVSPATFQQARQQWVAQGGSPDAFAQAFYGFINQSHVDDYI